MELILVLGALLGWCAAAKKLIGLPFGAAPLAAFSGAHLILLAGGMCGFLLPAKWLFCGVGWLALACLLRGPKAARAAFWRGLLTPGGVLFWAGTAALLLRLALLQPAFLNFDEYSFWGPASKMTALYHTLYPALDSGRPWVMTEVAGVPLMSYLFQSGSFAAWKSMLAVDLLMLACIAAAVTCAEKGGPRVWGPAALAAVLLPGVCSVLGGGGALSTVWLEILGDVPAGVLFGGAAAFWLAVRGCGRGRWLVWPVLCLAGAIKSNTMPLALAAAGLVFLDYLLLPPQSGPRGVKALVGRCGFGLVGLAVPLVHYLGWTAYVAPFVAANAQSGGMGDTAGASLPEVVVNGIKMLLGGTGTPYFEQRRGDMYAYAEALWTSFVSREVTLFGTGAVTCGVIGLVFVLALLAAPDLYQRLRVLVMAVGSAACFGGYWLMLWLSYAFIFKDSNPTMLGLASYVRYVNSYYAGWLLMALAMLGRQASKGRLAGKAGALLAGCLLAAVAFTGLQPQFTVLGVNRAAYQATADRAAYAETLQKQLEPDDTVFLISQGDNGFDWFFYSQALMPNILAYGAGGGTYGLPELAGETLYYQPYSAQAFDRLVRESGADCILIVKNDEVFTNSYFSLFSDELSAAQEGAALYRVTPGGYLLDSAWDAAGSLLYKKEAAQ